MKITKISVKTRGWGKEGDEQNIKDFFRAVELHGVILLSWRYAIIHFSKVREHKTLKAKSNASQCWILGH